MSESLFEGKFLDITITEKQIINIHREYIYVIYSSFSSYLDVT